MQPDTTFRFEVKHGNAVHSAPKFVAKSLSNKYVLLSLHATIFTLTWFFAFALRWDFDFIINETHRLAFLATVTWVVAIKLVVFYIKRHCHDIWYYATAKNIQQLILSSGIAVVLIFAFKAVFLTSVTLPRSIPVLDAILTVCFIGGLRLSLRIFRDEIRPRFGNRNYKNTLLVGANHEGGKLAHNIHSCPDLGYKIVGFITIHPEKVKMLLGNIPVLGYLDDIREVAKAFRVTDILVAAGILSGTKMRELSEICHAAGFNLRIVPQGDTRLGNRSIPIRDINIDDLLKRDPICLDDSKIRELVQGRRVLVTGGGGSIGSEICRQLVRFQPENLLILGRGENRIFFLERELKEMNLASNISRHKKCDLEKCPLAIKKFH